MAAASGITIDGLEDLQRSLSELLPNEAYNLARATNHAVASTIAAEGRKKAPRRSGTLRKAIKAKRGRGKDRARPFSDVTVEHGGSAKNDAFYWRFVEYGTKGSPAKGIPPQRAEPFLGPAVAEARGNIDATFREQFGRKLQAALVRKAKKARK